MQALEHLANELYERGIPVRREVPLAPYTSFRIGGPTPLLIEPVREEQLIAALCACREKGLVPLILGRGSNVLLPDEGLAMPVIRTAALRAIELMEDETVCAQSGANLSEICHTAAAAGLSGLEFAYGIPGTLGGAIYMNAGAYGGQMSDVVRQVRLYDREHDELLTLDGEEMEFAYRHSRLQREGERIVLGATLALTQDDPADIRTRMEDYMARRRDKQPLDYPSAGSTFKRPAGAFAGALIEQSGLKGYAVGGAMVSPKHAGFVINYDGATAEDVRRLIEHIRGVVLHDHGIDLEVEIQILTAHMAR